MLAKDFFIYKIFINVDGNNSTRPGPRWELQAFQLTLAHAEIWAQGPLNMSQQGSVSRSPGMVLSSANKKRLLLLTASFN